MPAFPRLTFARLGALSANGKMPPGWAGEHADEIVVEAIDVGPDGPAVTLTVSFTAANPAPFVSVVLGDYLPVPNEDVAALRATVEFAGAGGVSAAFLVLREWIAGGTYVGQATRPIPLDGGRAPAVAARMATGDSRVFQPLISFRRDGTDGRVTVRLAQLALGSLHDHPAWLSDGRGARLAKPVA